MRLWKNGKDVSVEDIYRYIKEKTKKMLSIYTMDGKGKLIDNQDATLSDLNLEEGDYFIVEVSDKYDGWYFKDS